MSQPEIKSRLVTSLREILGPYHVDVADIDIDIVNIRLAPEYREIVGKTEFVSYEKKQSEIRLETARKDGIGAEARGGGDGEAGKNTRGRS